MTHLLIALLLVAPVSKPAPLKRCVAACVREIDGKGVTCWFDELPACGRRSIECVDSAAVECLPRAVNLGEWLIVP